MAKLTNAQMNRAVGMLQTVVSSRAVARAFNSCHSTILCLWTLFQHTGDVSWAINNMAPEGHDTCTRPVIFLCVLNLSEIHQ